MRQINLYDDMPESHLKVMIEHAAEFASLCEWLIENHSGILSAYFKEKKEA
tara:strand:+ start:2187 stop:2339 length:153 start_codon:yes stop_codon:yes gene_type:complete